MELQAGQAADAPLHISIVFRRRAVAVPSQFWQMKGWLCLNLGQVADSGECVVGIVQVSADLLGLLDCLLCGCKLFIGGLVRRLRCSQLTLLHLRSRPLAFACSLSPAR